MARRTYESDGLNVETADDVDELVADKRQGWRANAAKARRRQRRYKKRLTNEIRYQSGTTIGGGTRLITTLEQQGATGTTGATCCNHSQPSAAAFQLI